MRNPTHLMLSVCLVTMLILTGPVPPAAIALQPTPIDRQIRGAVKDIRDRPIPEAPITISPAPAVPIISQADGTYQVDLAPGNHTVTITSPGYGVAPPMALNLITGTTVTHVLPPRDNRVQDGNFESGNLSAWQTFGNSVPAITTTAHSGDYAIALGVPSQASQDTFTDRLAANQEFGLTQAITVPGGLHQPTISLLYYIPPTQVSGNRLSIRITSKLPTTEIASVPAEAGAWQHIWADAAPWAGQTITLTIVYQQSPGNPAVPIILDEISLGSWPTPVINTASPSHLAPWTPGFITISGANFIANPSVRLDNRVLGDVLWINGQTLRARLYSGLPPGIYDVWVTNPGGQEAWLPGGLRVGFQVFLPIGMKGFH